MRLENKKPSPRDGSGCRENLDSLYFSLKYPFFCNKIKERLKRTVSFSCSTQETLLKTQPNLFCLTNSLKRITC
ncbi:hypothetical protein, partial [Bacillus subtilis]|uniref:hypothetical protein n=3 Tax=Bacillus subtilis TaxID=1423 RepID=UPI002DB74A19